MKILMFFLDMMTSQHLNVCNEQANNNEMDEVLRRLGGTVYANCYSPAPDTPRSSACMWTGLYPGENHCDCRLKWPKKHLNRNVDNIWEIFKKLDYRVNIYQEIWQDKLGLIPLTGKEKVYTESMYDLMHDAEITENTINYFYFPDFHTYLEEACYRESWGITEGIKFTAGLVQEVLDYYNATEVYDYIFMFADHGFHMFDTSHIISRERTNTLMYLWKKGDTELVKDAKLRANLDLMPTLCEILNYKPANAIDGISLLDEWGHDAVLIEDLQRFDFHISQLAEHWCVVDKKNSMHWLECNGLWEHEQSCIPFDEDKYLYKLKEKMTFVERNMSVYSTFKAYEEFVKEHRNQYNHYSNGERYCKCIYKLIDLQDFAGKKIILYGAGAVGTDYYKQLKKSGCDVVAWVDLNYEEIRQKNGFKITGIRSLLSETYDYVLICLANEKIVKQIVNMLKHINLDEAKIVWKKPCIIRE